MNLRTRYLGYGGLGLLLLAVVLFGVSTTESRYETVVSRAKGTVVAKEMRPRRSYTIYGVTYRVTIAGRNVEREGDVGSRKTWDSIGVGDEVDVEFVGDTANETRLALERSASSTVYRWIAGVMAAGGIVLLGLRIRG